MPRSKGKNFNLQRQSTRQTLPLASKEDVFQELKRYSRDPFSELLAEWIKAAPDFEDVKRFAQMNPDKWVNAVHHLSSMSGYSDKRETEMNVNLNVRQMSDSQLEDQLVEIRRQLDLEVVEVEEVAAESESDGSAS